MQGNWESKTCKDNEKYIAGGLQYPTEEFVLDLTRNLLKKGYTGSNGIMDVYHLKGTKPLWITKKTPSWIHWEEYSSLKDQIVVKAHT